MPSQHSRSMTPSPSPSPEHNITATGEVLLRSNTIFFIILSQWHKRYNQHKQQYDKSYKTLFFMHLEPAPLTEPRSIALHTQTLPWTSSQLLWRTTILTAPQCGVRFYKWTHYPIYEVQLEFLYQIGVYPRLYWTLPKHRCINGGLLLLLFFRTLKF